MSIFSSEKVTRPLNFVSRSHPKKGIGILAYTNFSTYPSNGDGTGGRKGPVV